MKHITCLLWILLSINFVLSAQTKDNFTIQGTVYDETDAPLPGVTIYLRDKISIGTISDSDGKFSLKVTRGDMIVFSFIGYKKVEYLATEAKTNLKIIPIYLCQVDNQLNKIICFIFFFTKEFFIKPFFISTLKNNQRIFFYQKLFL